MALTAAFAVSAVATPAGISGAADRPHRTRDPARTRRIGGLALVVLAGLTGCAGGIYGIGGGAILSPVLIGSGRPAAQVAPAALASTFVTSFGGVVTFIILSCGKCMVASNWLTGIKFAGHAAVLLVLPTLPQPQRRALTAAVPAIDALAKARAPARLTARPVCVPTP